MSSLKFITLILVALVMLVCAPLAMAQYDDQGDSTSVSWGALPLYIPEANDFAPSDDSGDADGSASSVGGSGYVDFSSYYKAGTLAPSYTFTPSLKARLRIPLIFSRTIEFSGGNATTSGLGDIALDAEYKFKFDNNGGLLRFVGTVKFPTGDHEAEDNNQIVPLGTGSMDFLGRLQYSRSTQNVGLIGTAMYRYNSAGETVSGDDFGSWTTALTNGNLFVLSGFGRYHAQGPWWLHFGVSLALTGDGTKVESYANNDDSSLNWEYESDIFTKSTLIDVFPGVSYNLGLFRPYLGVRIPVSSSYDVEDNGRLHADRDVSFVLQFTYNPKSMTSN